MKQAWQGLATKSNQEDWPAERFLATLLEQEILGREARRLERRRQESNLPPDKRLGNYDFTVVPTLSKAHVQALAEADGWIQEGANLLLFGPPGVGKSHLVAAVGHALVERGYRVYFTRTSDLVQQLQSARKELRLPATLTKLDRFDLLILDDFSYVRRDQAETSVLFELISERYERKSLAITANQPFSAWDQVFPEAAMTVAAVDRLVHRSTILELHAESYRRRTAKNRANVTVTTKEVNRDLEETDSQDGVVS
ncbi:ISAfe9, transposition helper protein, partial [Acidithiobacillus sp. GGI-221]